MKRNLLGALVGIAIFASVLFMFQRHPYFVGALEAHLDIFLGKYVIRVGGRVAAEKNEYNAVFKEYGFEMVAVGGCRVTEAERERALGYNSVSVTAIHSGLGKELRDEIQQRLGPVIPEREREKDREFARRCALRNQ